MYRVSLLHLVQFVSEIVDHIYISKVSKVVLMRKSCVARVLTK